MDRRVTSADLATYRLGYSVDFTTYLRALISTGAPVSGRGSERTLVRRRNCSALSPRAQAVHQEDPCIPEGERNSSSIVDRPSHGRANVFSARRLELQVGRGAKDWLGME